MECDVIPMSQQEVDPLGTVEHCNELEEANMVYSQPLSLKSDIIKFDHTDEFPKNRKIINITSPKSRKLINITSPTSPLLAHTTTVEDSSQNYRNVSVSHCLSYFFLSFYLKHDRFFILQKQQQILPHIRNNVEHQVSTMREVLASIPGFRIKPRRRTNKKLSTAAQIEQTREGCIDLESPDSILVSVNLRDLLNKDTFNALPSLYQYKLVQLLPSVDRPVIDNETETIRLNSSGLTNEFFTRACLEWKERLADGEFTPENQLKLRTEAEKEKIKLDPWKLKHFEPIWGTKSSKTKLTNRINSKRNSSHKTVVATKTSDLLNEAVTIADSVPGAKVKRKSPSTQSALKNSEMRNKNDLTLRSRPVVNYQTVEQNSSANDKQKISTNSMDRPSLKTTISFKSIHESEQSDEIPSSVSVSNNYTTSSGRIVKSPNNYPIIGTNMPQSQKKVRIGAVTRSLISSSSSNANFTLNAAKIHNQKMPTLTHSIQNTENVTAVKVIGPTIMPITTGEKKHFTKVCRITYSYS